MRRSVASIALLGWVATASEAASGSWQPAAPFKIVPEAHRCVATAAFVRGEQNLVLAIESHPSTLDYEMRLYAPGDLNGRPWLQGKYSLGSARLEREWVVARASTRAGTLIYTMDITKPALQSAGPNPVLKIRGMPTANEVTITGLEAAVSQLGACSANLLEGWGYSRDAQSAIASYAKPMKRIGSYASPSDYPKSALSSGAEGNTYALIDVGIDGRSTNCRVIRSSGNQELDRATCSIVTKRARYDPAKNERGDAVPAPYYLSFHWEIAK